MHRVYMMQTSAAEDTLPARCVMTGSTEDVAFKPCAVPVAGGGAVTLQLPFNDLAYKRWTAVRLLLSFAIFMALMYAVGAMPLALVNGPLAVVLFLGGCALPLWTYACLVRRTGPRIEKQRASAVVLLIPSAETARAFQPKVDEAECMVLTIQARQKAHEKSAPTAPEKTTGTTLRDIVATQQAETSAPSPVAPVAPSAGPAQPPMPKTSPPSTDAPPTPPSTTND